MHILGYVAAVSPEDKKGNDDDPLLDIPGYRIGKRGIEKAVRQHAARRGWRLAAWR